MSRRALGWLGLAFVVGTSFLYASSLLLTNRYHMAAIDSHYHFAVSRDIWRGDLAPDVARGLPWTVLRDMPVDHYWGYHLLLAPFAAFSNPTVGMKIAASALFALVFASIYLFMKRRHVPFAWAWALLPAMFSTQDWRYLQLRGGTIVVPLMFLLVHVALFAPRLRSRQRRAALVLIAYLGMLSYHGAVLLLPLHVVAVVAAKQRARFVDSVFVAAGLALALTVNPYMDARASTWRFAMFHLLHMANDSANLYEDQQVAEFRGFPLEALVANPEWIVLLVLALAAVAYVAWRIKKKDAKVDEIVCAALVLLTTALTARAMRMREYAVPLAVVLVGLLSRRGPRLRTFGRAATSALVVGLIGVGLTYHWDVTWTFIERHFATNTYASAREILEENGARPILNIAEADYCLLKWQKSDVVCVHGLSRYFIYGDKQLYHDVWELHDRPDTSPETEEILRRFAARGVRLVATHNTHKLSDWAEDHPDVLVPVWRSMLGATIWEITAPRTTD
jgi:hypothetical protein